MPTDVRLYLKQLEDDELSTLAKYIQAKIPKGSSSKKLVDILYSHHVSKQDVVKLLSKPLGRTGIYAKYDGGEYEKKVSAYFQKETGCTCTLNQRTRGTEFDVVCEKGRKGFGISNKKFIVIECKNTPIVTNQDLQKFAGKFSGFKSVHRNEVRAGIYDQEDDAFKGYLVTSGIFDPLAKEEARKHGEIELKRLRF